ncbi:MAG: helix-turn-helix domain-containing protein [Alphaproteobacteria bacterium]|nr:helix-turn-helix domain-containing protein [Alphaproteobacteria bacterium]
MAYDQAQRRYCDSEERRCPALPTHCATCHARQLSICGALDQYDLPGFATLSSHVRFRAGQTICEEGAPADWVFSVTSGVIGLHKALPDGRRQTTGFLFAGDLVGLSSRIVNACGAEAITDVEACRFARRRFETYMNEHQEVETRLLRMTADELSAAHDQMLLLGRKTARERVASFLLQLADRAARRRVQANPVLLPMKRLAIADYLGLTIETVSRSFTGLARLGVIEMVSVGAVRIVSMADLRDVAEGR